MGLFWSPGEYLFVRAELLLHAANEPHSNVVLCIYVSLCMRIYHMDKNVSKTSNELYLFLSQTRAAARWTLPCGTGPAGRLSRLLLSPCEHQLEQFARGRGVGDHHEPSQSFQNNKAHSYRPEGGPRPSILHKGGLGWSLGLTFPVRTEALGRDGSAGSEGGDNFSLRSSLFFLSF